MKLTAMVLAQNAEDTLDRCLKSLHFCDDIFVCDDYSTDKTLEIAYKYVKTKTLRRKVAGDFSAHRNFCLKYLHKYSSSTDWVLFIDADEEVPESLGQEIRNKVDTAGANIGGFYMLRDDKFFGRWLKHGETSRVKLLRLARRKAGIWKGRVHEAWQVAGKTGTLSHHLHHVRDLTLSQFIDRLGWYARLQALDLYEQKIKETDKKIFLNPIGKFLTNYFFKKGFLDGFPGLVMAFMMSWHSLLVRIWLKLYWLNDGNQDFRLDQITFNKLFR